VDKEAIVRAEVRNKAFQSRPPRLNIRVDTHYPPRNTRRVSVRNRHFLLAKCTK
jgi:hypothetical protein